MTRAVFDTNTLASGFVTPGGVGDQLLQHWLLGHFELVASEEIIDELVAVFAKPYFRARLGDKQAAENIGLLRRRATVAAITVQLSGVATHPADDIIISVAVSAQVDFLVTGDRRFRERVGTYGGVMLIIPRDFLAVLTAEAGPHP